MTRGVNADALAVLAGLRFETGDRDGAVSAQAAALEATPAESRQFVTERAARLEEMRRSVGTPSASVAR